MKMRERERERERERVTLRMAAYNQSVRLGVKPFKTDGQYTFFGLNTCVRSPHGPHVTSSLAAGSRQHSHSQVRVPVSDSRLPQPGGPGPRIYIPQVLGGPVILPGTGFPFRRLLRLAGLRWRYSTPPPHGV
jgi:hypothetical protein